MRFLVSATLYSLSVIGSARRSAISAASFHAPDSDQLFDNPAYDTQAAVAVDLELVRGLRREDHFVAGAFAEVPEPDAANFRYVRQRPLRGTEQLPSQFPSTRPAQGDGGDGARAGWCQDGHCGVTDHGEVLEVDLHAARDKACFLQACARDLRFPPHFGANWDAFSDCINDLAWQPAEGYVIVFDNLALLAQHAPDAAATALEILRVAADAWRARQKTFIVLLTSAPADAAIDVFPDLPLA